MLQLLTALPDFTLTLPKANVSNSVTLLPIVMLKHHPELVSLAALLYLQIILLVVVLANALQSPNIMVYPIFANKIVPATLMEIRFSTYALQNAAMDYMEIN